MTLENRTTKRLRMASGDWSVGNRSSVYMTPGFTLYLFSIYSIGHRLPLHRTCLPGPVPTSPPPPSLPRTSRWHPGRSRRRQRDGSCSISRHPRRCRHLGPSRGRQAGAVQRATARPESDLPPRVCGPQQLAAHGRLPTHALGGLGRRHLHLQGPLGPIGKLFSHK